MSTLASTTTDHDHGVKATSEIAPGEIAVGVVVGRASEYFDFFVYGIASVLVVPSVFFPHMDKLDGTLWAFALFALAFVGEKGESSVGELPAPGPLYFQRFGGLPGA